MIGSLNERYLETANMNLMELGLEIFHSATSRLCSELGTFECNNLDLECRQSISEEEGNT